MIETAFVKFILPLCMMEKRGPLPGPLKKQQICGIAGIFTYVPRLNQSPSISSDTAFNTKASKAILSPHKDFIKLFHGLKQRIRTYLLV